VTCRASSSGLRVAVIGATGLVGRTLVRILGERSFPVGHLQLFASPRSAGEQIAAFGGPVQVLPLDSDIGQAVTGRGEDGAARRTDIAFFAAGEPLSSRFAPDMAARGTLVIDKSAAFRSDAGVPLVVPEVNIASARGHTLIANPNCATIPLAVLLAPIRRAFGLQWVSVSTYQSVSGAGRHALDGFHRELAGAPPAGAFPRQIAGNVFPENGTFDGEGHAEEERKIAAELRKILGQADLRVSATSVRVPVAVGHAEAVAFQTEAKVSREDLASVLARAPGIRFLDGCGYESPAQVAGRDDVSVGRLRADLAHPGAFLAWVACDNLRKGAATNAVQIAEAMLGLPHASTHASAPPAELSRNP